MSHSSAQALKTLNTKIGENSIDTIKIYKGKSKSCTYADLVTNLANAQLNRQNEKSVERLVTLPEFVEINIKGKQNNQPARFTGNKKMPMFS